MKIHVTSMGEGHEAEDLANLMHELELVAMRAGFAHVFVSGETESANMHLASDPSHPRSKWKREWAAGTTSLQYHLWREQDCKETCGAEEGEEDTSALTASRLEVEEALGYLFGAYVQAGAKDNDELMIFSEWQAALFDSLGLSLRDGVADRMVEIAGKLSTLLSPAKGFDQATAAASLAKASRVAAMNTLSEEHASYTEGTLNALPFLQWFATIRAAGSAYFPANAI